MQLFRVLIASPGDVRERNAVRNEIIRWSVEHSESRQIALLPLMWEDAAPTDLRDRPQRVINRHLVDHCDMCIALFWNRIGTPTDEHEGGAVEEVVRMVRRGLPTSVFFNDAEPPDNHDPVQRKQIEALQTRWRNKGFTGNYNTKAELLSAVRTSLSAHVTELSENALDDGGIIGEWIEIKEQNARKPYALVQIAPRSANEYAISGVSYGADGKKDTRWPDGALDFSGRYKDGLIHCFDAKSRDSNILGLTFYEFEKTSATVPGARPQRMTGQGFYAHHADGSDHKSDKVEFKMERVTPGLVKRLTGKDELRNDNDRRQFIRRYHRDRKQQRIVLTGGAYSGKSSLLRRLREEGYRVIPEAAIHVIGEGRDEREDYDRWRAENPVQFQLDILERQLHNERRLMGNTREWVVMDRSGLDGIAYLKHEGVQEIPQEYSDYAAGLPVGCAFLLETLKPFDPRRQTGRQGDEKKSRKIHDLLYTVYDELGWEVMVLSNNLSIEERAQQVLEFIEEMEEGD